MNKCVAALLCAGLLAGSLSSASADDRAMEQYLLSVPTATAAFSDATRVNAESHYAGTPGDYHIATWMRDQLAAAGFTASLEAFSHDVPFPKRLVLQIVNGKNPTDFTLTETPIPSDPDGTRRDAGPPFNAWSGSGTVYAPLIDAGHGLESDYASLSARGLNVRKDLVLVRYGREFRGNLAKRAQDHGASGVIFFSDPMDRDGSQCGPAYPDGPYRPLGAIQRGSLGPGITIPTLPVTATVAARLLDTMRDGVSSKFVRLTVEMEIKHTTLWNTVGVLIGKDPTHEVILGAHRDAWVYGVTDNGSGVSNVLEAARALGYIHRIGWRPQYTIVIAGFDGEEIGEVGSEAYVRMHHDALSSGAVAYINADETTTGKRFDAMAAAALEGMIEPAAWTVKDPAAPTQPLATRWKAQTGGEQISSPAGGSDFEAFLYEIGTPVIDVGFGGIFGVYHSGFDDLRYAQTQADPGFVNHLAVAQFDALLLMRIASGAAPYRLAAYAPRMRDALKTLSKQSGSAADLSPLAAAIGRFASRASRADARGMDGNQEIAAVHRLNMLFYSRNGYAGLPFPYVSDALASGNQGAVSASIGRTAHDLDDITGAISGATH
jgi:N-acetylated-alpha-linked acidic dipeptidase